MWPKPKLQPSKAMSRRREIPSISQRSPVKAGIRRGSRWSGGKAAVASAPHSAAAPCRRQPDSPASAALASLAVTGARDGSRRQVAYPQAFDAAWIGLHDLEAHPARGVGDELASGRDAIR